MKKIISLIFVFLTMVGCSTAKNEPITKSDEDMEIKEGEIMYAEHQGNFPIDITNPKIAYDDVNAVAIIRIDSINTNNYSEVNDCYTFTYTYGKASVQNVYKGELTQGQEITYYRLGGKIKFEDFYKGQSSRQQEKLDTMEKKPEYVIERFKDDIDVEVGKTYLAYIVPKKDIYNNGGYAIDFYQTGLREIDGNPHAKTGIKVYNNYTKQWESMEQVLPQ